MDDDELRDMIISNARAIESLTGNLNTLTDNVDGLRIALEILGKQRDAHDLKVRELDTDIRSLLQELLAEIRSTRS